MPPRRPLLTCPLTTPLRQETALHHVHGHQSVVRQAFELTRQAIGYRMLQWLALPLHALDRAALQSALDEIGRR